MLLQIIFQNRKNDAPSSDEQVVHHDDEQDDEHDDDDVIIMYRLRNFFRMCFCLCHPYYCCLRTE